MLITSGSLKVKGFLYIFKNEFVITFITPCILWFFIGIFCLNKVYIVYSWLLYLTWQELHNKIIKELRRPKKTFLPALLLPDCKSSTFWKNVNKFQVMWLRTLELEICYWHNRITSRQSVLFDWLVRID